MYLQGVECGDVLLPSLLVLTLLRPGLALLHSAAAGQALHLTQQCKLQCNRFKYTKCDF